MEVFILAVIIWLEAPWYVFAAWGFWVIVDSLNVITSWLKEKEEQQ